MREKRNVLIVLCTLLLVLAGACMPVLVSAFQDKKLESQTGSRDTPDVTLTLRKADNMGGTLALFSSSHTSYDLSKERQERTEAEAEAAAAETLELLRQEELIPDEALTPVSGLSSVFFQVSEADSSLISVIWRCIFKAPDDSILSVYIDDTTGKLVGISKMASNAIALGLDTEDPQWQAAEAARWAAFCQSYYGFDTGLAEKEWLDEGAAQFVLVLTGAASDEYVECRIPLIISDGYIYFNFRLNLADTVSSEESNYLGTSGTVTGNVSIS